MSSSNHLPHVASSLGELCHSSNPVNNPYKPRTRGDGKLSAHCVKGECSSCYKLSCPHECHHNCHTPASQLRHRSSARAKVGEMVDGEKAGDNKN